MNDLQQAVRQLAKAPGFTALAVLSLAVGIGINSTIFSVMDAAFLRPLPLKDPEAIVKLEWPGLTFDECRQAGAQMTSLSSAAISGWTNVLLKGADRAELLRGRTVSSNYFTTLGAAPAAGRFFTERSPNLADNIVVVSHRFWQRRFAASPAAIGQTIELGGTPFTIVGVAAPGFTGEDRLPPTEVWFPAESRGPQVDAGRREFHLVGRLAPSASVTQARTEAAVVVERVAPDARQTRWGARAYLVSERQSRMDHGGRLTFFMGPIVGLVLLVACANVSCLLLGRHEQRRREIAVRLALGAGRWRLMRFLLAEAALLALAGGLGGLLLTAWGTTAVHGLLPATFAAWMPDVRIDQRVLGLTLGLATFATLAVGLMPAWRASGLDVSAMLKSEGAVHLGKLPGRHVLVCAQVMIAMVFLTLAALLGRGFWTGLTRDLGFSERNLLLAYLVPERARDLPAFLDEVQQTLTALPGVRAVTVANALVGGGPVQVQPPAEAADNAGGRPFPCNFVDPGYFTTVGIALLHGRDFTAHDHRGSARVAIVSESMARQFWPGGNPVGQTLFAGRTRLAPCEVIGVVRDVTDLQGNRLSAPGFYLALRQEQARDLMLIVKTAGAPAALAAPVRDALRRMASPAGTLLFDTVDGRLRASLMPQWLGAWLGGTLGLLAFVLALGGLYGAVAYAVARRTRELGIRVALGASPREALWLIVRQGVILSVFGTVAGALIAIGAGQLLASLLVGISPADPLTLAASAALVVATATLAAWLPARRVLRLNPIEVLRAE